MGEPAVRDGLLPDTEIPRLRPPSGKKHQQFIVKELLLNENQDFVWSDAVKRRPLQPGVQCWMLSGTGLLREARLLREGLWLREDLLPADHASPRFVLWSEGPVCLQALRRLRDLRPGEGLLPGTGLLCEARLLREGLLCCPLAVPSRLAVRSRLAGEACGCERKCCHIVRGGLRAPGLLREGLRAAAVPSPLAARRPVVARPAAAARRGAAVILCAICATRSSP